MIKIADGFTGGWVYFDGFFVEASAVMQSQSSHNFFNSVYEIVRVIGSVPVFIEEHFCRFENSLKSFDVQQYISLENLKKYISDLCERNNLVNGNLRFEYYFSETAKAFVIYQVPHVYPSDDMYIDGVKLVSFQIERPNPNIKQSVVNSEVRSRIAEVQKQANAYEVVLVNHLNNITEGSKSNVFFISESTIYTAPSELILEGITRKRLMHILKTFGFQIVEKPVPILAMKNYDACFLTGTSPKILPVSQIDSINFNPQHPLVQELMQLFNQHIADYCKSYEKSLKS
jgi:branched-chain amino acid aminotransferase